MLDLETMGTGANSAIIAIGAVKFSSKIDDRFYAAIDLDSCLDAGLDVDGKTIMWWLKQSDDARAQFTKNITVGLSYALKLFSDWIGENAIIWGNGAAFDNAILSNAYRALTIKQPWFFWNDRCYRTVANFFPPLVTKPERIGTYHNAVDDAESQALHLISIGGELLK